MFCYCHFHGSAYAYQYIITNNDASTLANYFVADNNNKANEWRNNVVSILTYWGAERDTLLVSFSSSGNLVYFKCLALNKSQITSVSNLNNINFMSVTYNGTAVFREQIYQGPYNSVQQNSDNNYTLSPYTLGYGAQTITRYILYNNDLTDVIIGPYESADILGINSSFYFNMRSSSQFVNQILDDENVTDIPVYSYNGGNFYFGDLVDREYLNYINDQLVMYYYNGSNWISKELFFRVWNNDDNLTIPNNNIVYNTRLSGNPYNSFYINGNYCYSNVFYWYSCLNGDGSQANAVFYLADANTVISNNSVDTSSFGSDYYNQFDNLDLMINDNNNTENIIDNLSDDQKVDSILAGLNSGDGLAANMGYNPIPNNYWTFIYNMIEQICDTITGTGDVYFDYSLHGENPTRIYSSDIYLPDGHLKTFLSLSMTFGAVYILYLHFKSLLDSLNTLSLEALLNYSDVDINYFRM